MIALVGRLLGSAAFKSIGGELRRAYESRLNAQNNAERIAADVRIKELEAELTERQRKLTDPLLKLPLFVAEMSVAVYLAAIMIDSTFPMQWLTPLELPNWFKPHFYLIVASIFGISAAERYFKRK